MAKIFDNFSGLLRAALGDSLTQTGDFISLFTDDVVFEFPYAPEGAPRRLDGQQALADHLARIGPALEFGELTLHAVHPAGDTVTIEFACNGRGLETGAAYKQSYVSVVTLQNKKIAHYRDYWNPLIVLSALGGPEQLARVFGRKGSR